MPQPPRASGARFVRMLASLLAALGALTGPAWAQVADPTVVVLAPAFVERKTTTDETVRLDMEISAFSKITGVKINGEAQAAKPADTVTVSGTFPLVPGENKFLVEVDTEVGRTAKEFVITRVAVPSALAPAPTEAKPLGLIAAAGLQNQSNVFRTHSDAKSASRQFVMAIPSYVHTLDERSSLRFQGIFSRDRYSSSDFTSQEIAFNQVTAARVAKLEGKDYWQAGAGLNLVDNEYVNYLAYKHRVEQDVFGFASLRRYSSDTGFHEWYGEVKTVDLANQPSGNYDASGTILTGRGDLETELGSWHGRFRGALSLYNAGKYETRTILRGSADATTPMARLLREGGGGAMDKLIVGGSLRARQETFSASDPALGKAASNTLLTVALLANYALAKNWVLSGEYYQENQASNVAGLKYDNTSLTLTVIYVY